MARTIVRVEGLRELEASLADLGKSLGKGVLRRVLTRRGQPIADAARSKVRVDEGDLRDSIGVGTKLTRRQRSLHRKEGSKDAVEVFVGAGGLVQAITEEFGTVDQAPHPFLRPAWDSGKGAVLDGLKEDLAGEIDKAVKRRAKRAAAKAAKG